MSVRLVITMNAQPGKGAELLKAMEERCREVRKEPGCEQFEAFQSGADPDRLVLLELWASQDALDVHAKLNASQPPNPAMVRLRADGVTQREDYEYNRTR
jgi:quinol monooxygenase YgiN